MKKITLMALILSAYSTVQAAPNLWQDDFAQGFNLYSIQNSKNQKFRVSCNTGGVLRTDHSVELIIGQKEYGSYDKKSSFSFVLDGKAFDVPLETKTRLGGNAWDRLMENLGKAKKIDVFINNKKMASFTATNVNKAFTNDIVKTCISLQHSNF